jgi:hypothetical protein
MINLNTPEFYKSFLKEKQIELKNCLENRKVIFNDFKKEYLDDDNQTIAEFGFIQKDKAYDTEVFTIVYSAGQILSMKILAAYRDNQLKLTLLTDTQVSGLDTDLITEYTLRHSILMEHFLFLNDNQELLISLFEKFKNSIQLKNDLLIEINENQKTLGISKARKEISRFSKVFPLVEPVDLNSFIQKRFLALDLDEKENAKLNGFKVQLSIYDFSAKNVQFSTRSFLVFTDKEGEYSFKCCQENRTLTHKNIQKIINRRFRFRGEIVLNNEQLKELKLKGKRRIDYDNLFSILKLDFLQSKIKTF